jgi:type IV pilus assembly protein PilC
MPIFKIKAKDGKGSLIAETLEADTQRDVIDILHRRGLIVIGIELARARGGKTRLTGKVKAEDLVVFSRQLSTMVNAGLPLIDGLRTLSEQIERETFRRIIDGVVSQIEGGSSFADSIARYPQVFGSFFINMARAGEASGKLAEILRRIADYLESINSLKHKIKMAMMYPTIVSIMAGLITIILFLKVIPVFEGIFADFGADLPLPTKILIGISKWMREYFFSIVIGFIISVIFLVKFKKTEKGRGIYDRLTFKLPIFGDLFKKVAISKFCKTLGTLVQSGVPILTALEIVKEVAGNKLVEKAVIDATEKIKEGKTIEDPLKQSGIFPAMVTKMINIGEKSGKLEEMLNKVSEYYDEQVASVVAGLTSLIEPLLIAFLGIVVGGIVISMFLPIFKLATVVSA